MSATVLLAATMPWPFPAQLAGAFAAAGARVEALCPQGSMLAASRHVAQRHDHQLLAPDQALRRAIAAAKADLIIPCDDDAAAIMQRVCGTRAVLGRSEFLARATAAGAPVAHTIAVADEDALEAAMREIGLPLVVKSDRSWGGDGVIIAETRDAARQAFCRLADTSRLRDLARAVLRRKSHFLTRALFPASPGIGVQRFIGGRPATSSIACWNGVLVGAQHFDVLVTAKANGPASVIARTDCPRMEDSARRIATALKLSGLFGLDYIRDAQGQVHLLEMNPRATPTAHLALDQDLAGGLLRAAGFAARRRPAVTQAREIALFPREWMRDPASPWLTAAFHDVPWDDPAVVQACLRPVPVTPGDLLDIRLGEKLPMRAAADGRGTDGMAAAGEEL